MLVEDGVREERKRVEVKLLLYLGGGANTDDDVCLRLYRMRLT